MDRHGPDTDMHGPDPEGLIPRHGGFRRLKTFRLATLIYDVTARFCATYLDERSRTVDQMTQAARSGRQNIAEASMDSGTSKKSELKLTGIARGSLEKLRLDYEDYLRQRDLPQWPPEHPALVRFKARRCATLLEFRRWVGDEVKRARETRKETGPHGPDTDTHGRDTDPHGRQGGGQGGGPGGRGGVQAAGPGAGQGAGPCQSVSGPCGSVSRPCPSVFVANGALSLLNLCIYLLGRQLESQAATFEKEGGFTERLYRRRTQARRNEKDER